MGFWEHTPEFNGKQVYAYEPGKPLLDVTTHAPRLAVEYDSGQSGVDLLRELLQDSRAEDLQALVLGPWFDETFEDAPTELIDTLMAAAPRLQSLRGIFFGDIISEECEVSWINLGDLSPLWDAYPLLEEFIVRGGEGLSLGNISHRHLKSLVIQTGGLDSQVLKQLAESSLGELEKLRLYLGDPYYGWNGTLEDLEPLMQAETFPKLKYLGLCNANLADEIAQAVTRSSVLKQLEVLDLSLGTLGDEGARALLGSPDVKRLKRLNLEHHYVSAELQQQLSDLGIEVNLADAEGPQPIDERYVSVSE